jgi:serine/threonine-protein kinase
MAISSVGEYLSALEKSKLLGSEQLAAAQRLAGGASDAAELARALARDNLVSRWQAGTLLALGQRAQLRLGKYKLIQRLGKGGMGTVFLAEHVTMNRRVALKVVPRAIAEDRASLDRFFAEARAIAALDHPNIVQAYSVDNEMDRYFIVMEFVDGHDLQQLVEANGPLDFEHAADYIRQAAEGLAHAHARNLVHCDIKPSNLLVNNQGVVKILDLGLARLNQSDDPRSSASGGPAIGTVDYMAPEQALQAADFDHRADIYSLGCTLYFLLTGHPPFPEGSLAQRIVKHQTQEPRDILLERPNTPPKLVEVCKRMMAKAPADRYQSILEVSAALGPRLNGASGSSGPMAVRVPQPVKLLAESAPVASEADDWLSVIASSANGASPSVKMSASAVSGRSSKSGKRHNKKSAGGIAAMAAGLWAKRAWFNTTPRKILGGIGGFVTLTALAGLAALPFLLSNSPPASQTPQQSKAEEKKGPLAVDGPVDKEAEKMLSASRALRDKNAPTSFNAPASMAAKNSAGKPQVKPPEEPPVNPPQVAQPKSPGPAASIKQPEVAITKPDVKPAPSVLVETKPEPPKPASFDGLLAEVDLPPLGKPGNAEVSLGKLDLDPRLKVDAELLGGDLVAKGNPKFGMHKEGEGATGGWSVEMTERNRDTLKIARVWQDQGECKFHWTADARDKSSLVRFCGLNFSSDKQTRFVALCSPKKVPPLWIDVDRGMTQVRLSRDFTLPDASLLRLQVLPLDNSLPKHTIKIQDPKAHFGRTTREKSSNPVSGDTVPARGHVIVVLTKEKTPSVSFRVSFSANTRGKDVILDMTSSCEVAHHAVPFNLNSLQGVAAEVGAFLMISDASQKKNGKAAASAEQIQAAKSAKDEVKALGDLAGELSQKASIPFRIYSILGETSDELAPKVVIFQSGQMEKSKPAGAKKNTQGSKSKGRAPLESDELKFP